MIVFLLAIATVRPGVLRVAQAKKLSKVAGVVARLARGSKLVLQISCCGLRVRLFPFPDKKFEYRAWAMGIASPTNAAEAAKHPAKRIVTC